MTAEEDLLKLEKKLKKEEDVLNLLKEQFNTFKLLIELEFGDFFPDGVKEYIVITDSIISDHSGKTFKIVGDYPDDEYCIKPDIAKGMKMYKDWINCFEEEITNNEKLLLINYANCIEKIAACELSMYYINDSIRACKLLKNYR